MFNIIIKKKTFTNNDITIEFPAGYSDVQAYRRNLVLAVNDSRTDPEVVSRNKAMMTLIDKALAE